MSKILAIVRKDTLLRFTSPSEWLFFLVLPIAFTFILAGGTGTPADSRIRLDVVDLADSPLSAELVSALDQSEAVRPQLLSLDKAEDEFAQRRVSAVLIIPAGFDRQHLEEGTIELELRQQPSNVNALVASRAVAAVTNRVAGVVDIAGRSAAEAERLRPFESGAARRAYLDVSLQQAQALMATVPDRIAVTRAGTKDQVEYDPRANSSAGQLITWVFIPLIGISAMFAYERESGTLRRLLVTPTSQATYLLGTIVGQVATALVQMLLLLSFGAVVMRLDWGHSPTALALMLTASTLAAAALGTTLGTVARTTAQANGLSIMLGMVMALLGGCWYPIELFPPFVRAAVKILPTNWAMQGMLDIVLRGKGLSEVLPEAGVLAIFAAVFFSIGVWRFRYE